MYFRHEFRHVLYHSHVDHRAGLLKVQKHESHKGSRRLEMMED